MFHKNFLICGLTGWCMEIIFTSIGAFRQKDLRLIGQTSLWMFPIYGMAAFIKPIYRLIRHFPGILRGIIYSLGIFTCEYVTGTLLKKHHSCPWDYSNAPSNINGVIRLDYAPYWFFAGLLFERIVTKDGHE